MKENSKIIKLVVIIFIIFIGIFLDSYFNISNAARKGEYAEVKPGDVIYLPDYRQYPQSSATIELDPDAPRWRHSLYYDVGRLADIWREKGRHTNEIGQIYIPVAGIDWVYVAVSPTFGKNGDYLKVHIQEADTGKEVDYYMIIFDHKGHDNMYWANGVHWGHKAGSQLNVLEFPWHGEHKMGSNREGCYNRARYKNVIYIANGGNYFENPNGPVGFSAVSTMEYEKDVESSTFVGAMKQTLRNVWDAVTTFIGNSLEDENKSTSLFNLYNESDLVWPLPGHTRVSSGFGERISPTDRTTRHFHTGIDIGAKEGELEVAAGTGTIETAGYFSKGSGYQCYLYLDDKTSFGGEVIFGYLHGSPTPIVKAGDHVVAGQPMTTVGPMWVTVPGFGRVTNGSMTGTHLHFSMRIDGEHVDPEIYFPEEMRE